MCRPPFCPPGRCDGHTPEAQPEGRPLNRKPDIVLARVLRALRPLVRLLVRQGVGFPALANALKPVFVEAAEAELADRGMARTDSALTLLSGVHRRDVRTLTRQTAVADAPPPPLSLAAEVVARWMSEPLFLDGQGRPLSLPRGRGGLAVPCQTHEIEPVSFDALVAGVSSDVRARAVLEELLRLGVVHEDSAVVHLHGDGFAPQQGFDEMAWLMADNLHDHAAAATANLQGQDNFLEQAVFVDQIGEDSVAALKAAARQAWQQAFRTVMNQAQNRFDADAAALPAAQRNQRARFGVYFYSAPAPPPDVPGGAPPTDPPDPPDATHPPALPADTPEDRP